MKNFLATLLLFGVLAFVGCTGSDGPDVGDNDSGSGGGTVGTNDASDKQDASKTKIDPKDRQ